MYSFIYAVYCANCYQSVNESVQTFINACKPIRRRLRTRVNRLHGNSTNYLSTRETTKDFRNDPAELRLNSGAILL